MGATLETLAAQAVYTAALFERALHDPGPWTMTCAGQTVSAERSFTPRGVVFHASFPEVCYLVTPDPTVTLECAGALVAVKTIDHPGDAAFDLAWAIDAQVLPV